MSPSAPSQKASIAAAKYYRVVATDSQASEPREVIATSAVEAEFRYHAFQRLGGKYAKVEVFEKGGRSVSLDRLRRVADAERAADPTVRDPN